MCGVHDSGRSRWPEDGGVHLCYMSSLRPMTSLSPADHLALADLVHRYAAGVDDRDLDAVVALFTSDATMTAPVDPGRSPGTATHDSLDAITTALGAVHRLPVTVHAVVGTVFDAVSPDEATGRVACVAHHAFERDGGGRDDTWHVVYRDRYRRTDAGWRFASRVLEVRLRTAGEVRIVGTGVR